ncbi:hypothetical protein FRC20_001458, partial [Serendipita sp. 405]
APPHERTKCVPNSASTFDELSSIPIDPSTSSISTATAPDPAFKPSELGADDARLPSECTLSSFTEGPRINGNVTWNQWKRYRSPPTRPRRLDDEWIVLRHQPEHLW